MAGRGVLVAAVLLARAASAQTASTPPPPPGGGGEAGSRYHELLPDIGRIGAEVGAAAGLTRNPYGLGTGWEVGAFIDLPLARHRPGRLSYEILMALSGAERDSSRERLRLLEVSPFALRYTLTRFDGVRLRPYLTAGVDVTVAAAEQSAGPFPSFGTEDGRDTTIGLGAHAGAGVEVRLSRGLSLNLAYRYLRAEESQSLHSATAAVGFHW